MQQNNNNNKTGINDEQQEQQENEQQNVLEIVIPGKACQMAVIECGCVYIYD